MPKQYIFRTGLRWNGLKRGSLSSAGKPDIGISTPPEFKGEEGYWSPEELLISAVETCIMTTFLHYAERKEVGIVSYESEAEGILEKADGRFMISGITVKPDISVESEDKIDRAKELMAMSENNCFISNSIKSGVKIMPAIKAGG